MTEAAPPLPPPHLRRHARPGPRILAGRRPGQGLAHTGPRQTLVRRRRRTRCRHPRALRRRGTGSRGRRPAGLGANALTRLALVILLDQFTRNVFAAGSQAFAGDARAQQLVLRTIAAGEDLALPCVGRVFLYMPLMHAENLALQDECVARFTRLQRRRARLAQTAPARQPRLRPAAPGHRGPLRPLPYRNAALGRADTPEEQDFLLKGPRFGQQTPTPVRRTSCRSLPPEGAARLRSGKASPAAHAGFEEFCG